MRQSIMFSGLLTRTQWAGQLAELPQQILASRLAGEATALAAIMLKTAAITIWRMLRMDMLTIDAKGF